MNDQLKTSAGQLVGKPSDPSARPVYHADTSSTYPYFERSPAQWARYTTGRPTP